MDKVPGMLSALLLYYVIPLCARWQLIGNPWILIPMLVCIVVFLTQPAAHQEQANQRQDQHSMKWLIAATVLSQAATMIEWAYFRTNHEFAWRWTTALGLSLMGGGLALRIRAIRLLNHFFTNTICIQPGHRLIQQGPYSVIRHPSYTGVIMIALGIAVFLEAWVSSILTVAVLGWAYAYRIKKEEEALLDRFGDVYRAYQKKTHRLLPGIW